MQFIEFSEEPLVDFDHFKDFFPDMDEGYTKIPSVEILIFMWQPLCGGVMQTKKWGIPLFWYFAFIVSLFSYLCSKKTIKATSPLGDPRVTYNLEDGMVPETNMPVRFYLTPNREDGSASILVAEPLDYETTKNFMLRVRAQNVAAVPLAAFTTVYVNVTGKPSFIHAFFL